MDVTSLPEFKEYERSYKELQESGRKLLYRKGITDEMKRLIQRELDVSYLVHQTIFRSLNRNGV